MVRVQTRDGRTRTIDLANPEEARALLRDLASDRFQREITAVSLVGEAPVAFVAPREPSHFHVERVEATGKNKGGERLLLFTGEVRLAAMSHARQPSVRISLSRIGRRVAAPRGEGR